MENTEKTVREQALGLIRLKIQLCLMNLASDISIAYADEGDELKDYDMPSEVNEIKKSLFDAVKRIDDFISEPFEKRADFVNQIKQSAERLKKVSFPIYMNISLLEQLFSKAGREYKTRQLSRMPKQTFSAEAVLRDCRHFINSSSDKYKKMVNMGSLISCFPPNMADDKYDSYIDGAFEIMFDGIQEDTARKLYGNYKLRFAPFKAPDLGKSFPLITDKLSEIFKMDFSSLKEEDFEEICDMLENCDRQLAEITSELGMYYNDLMYVLNILSVCKDSEYIFEDNYVIKDIYYTLKSIDQNTELAQELNERASDIIEDMLDRQKLEEDSFNKVMNGLDAQTMQGFSEDTSMIIDTLIFTDKNYKTELIEDVFSFVNIPAQTDKSLIKSLADDFKAFVREVKNEVLKENFENMKQMFFSVIPCPLSDKELIGYMRDIFDENEDNDIVYIVLDRIITLFKSQKFMPKK